MGSKFNPTHTSLFPLYISLPRNTVLPKIRELSAFEEVSNSSSVARVNNIFNLAYDMLSWKIHRAVTKAKLEPYLGFLHSVQYGKPSLVCDLQELYRYLLDDFARAIVPYSYTFM